MVPHWVPHFQIQIAIDLKRMGTPGTPKSHSLSLSRLECQALYHVPTCHIFWWIHGIKNLSVLTHRHLHRSDGTSHASSDSRTSTAGIVGGFFLGNRRKLQLKDSSNWTLPGKTICWLVVTGTMEFYDFPYIGNNDPNWLKKIRGVGIPPTRDYGHFGHWTIGFIVWEPDLGQDLRGFLSHGTPIAGCFILWKIPRMDDLRVRPF